MNYLVSLWKSQIVSASRVCPLCGCFTKTYLRWGWRVPKDKNVRGRRKTGVHCLFLGFLPFVASQQGVCVHRLEPGRPLMERARTESPKFFSVCLSFLLLQIKTAAGLQSRSCQICSADTKSSSRCFRTSSCSSFSSFCHKVLKTSHVFRKTRT